MSIAAALPLAMESRKSSLIDSLRALPLPELTSLIQSLTDEEATLLLYDWPRWARPNQLAPPGDWRTWLILAGRGFGKLLSLCVPIPTPAGWTTMGQLRVGDQVFDETGAPCNVIWISDEQVPESAYRLSFSNGSNLDACSEHEWVTWTHSERKAFLRSPYEDISCFPKDWPNWKLRRITGHSLPQGIVDEAISLNNQGFSARSIGKQLAVCRVALRKHLAAGLYLARQAKVYPDSPGPRIRLTREIAETLTYSQRGDLNHCIPNCGPLQLPEAVLPIPPYTLGVWLGDGACAGATVTQHEPDQASLRKNLVADGFHCTTRADPKNIGVLGLHKLLRQEGLLFNKHVPAIYLRASVQQRLALLQGLMDTDGGVEAASTVSFTNCTLALSDAVYELVVSLGMRATRDSRKTQGNGPAHRVTFTPTMQVFRLPRKANRVSFTCGQQLRRHHRMITGAEPIDPVPMRCITVDSPNSLYLAGREMIPTHNSRTGAEWVRDQVEHHGRRRIALVGRTSADCRKTMIEGEAGLLSVFPPQQRPVYEPSRRQVTFANGAIAITYSSEEPNLLRGPSHDAAWADEAAAFFDAGADDWQVTTWSNLQMGLRLGQNPQQVVTTTPKPIKLIRQLLAAPTTVITRGTTYENRRNLADAFYTDIISRYEGTRLGRQELHAEVLEDIEGALWTRKLIDQQRVQSMRSRDIKRTVVAIDPAVTSGEESDETGIIVAAEGVDGRGYVLADLSCRLSPDGWARRAVGAFHEYNADRIIAETNNGGDLVERVLRTVDSRIPYRKVTASRGKLTRAEPIAALYEQQRISHVGAFDKLEDEMVTYSGQAGERSPNRLDGLVWALSELFLEHRSKLWVVGV